jgi:hypothetical protein
MQHIASTGIISQPAEAVSIITTDIDGTADWSNGTPADGVSIFSSLTYLQGRVVISLDFNWLRDSSDGDADGSFDYYDEDNEVLAVNTIRWLSAAGLKERIVLYDESHSANFFFDASYSGLSEFLTDNGYTIKWMDTFYPSLINQADVLIVCDGSIAYSGSEITAITDFVASGGGLFLVGGESTYGAEVDPIGNAFGIDRNDTGYIEDSDDYISSTSYVVYNASNLGIHPITQGISRLEMIDSSAFDTIGSATPLLITDSDGTSTWSDGGPANSVPIAVALTHQLGRVFYSADYRFCRTGADIDGDGVFPLYEHDNILYVQNIFQWLSANRAPVVSVTSPNGGEIIEGATNTITWTAQDPNKDSMTYDILYSVNGGGSWTPIATDHTITSINWDASSVPESLDALIRVVAHDYELTGQDDSDAVFSVESEGPQISNIQTTPAVPLANIPVTASADIIDASGVASAVCQVSTDGGSIWTDFSMTLVSGTTYEANIGVFASGTVEYRIMATDSSAAARTRTSPVSSFTIAALPPVIPGFPIEAIVLALAAGLGFIILVRRRRTVSS